MKIKYANYYVANVNAARAVSAVVYYTSKGDIDSAQEAYDAAAYYATEASNANAAEAARATDDNVVGYFLEAAAYYASCANYYAAKGRR